MLNYNPCYDDCYFSTDGAFDEATWVFIEGNRLSRLTGRNDIFIGETGFGTGLNLFSLAFFLSGIKPEFTGTIHFFSCEKYLLTPDKVELLLMPQIPFMNKELISYTELYTELYNRIVPGINTAEWLLFGKRISLTLFAGDVLDYLDMLQVKIDAWFLDGHDPAKNPDMWSDNVFRGIRYNSMPGTTLSSYTACGMVKEGLRRAGFIIRRKKGYGKKRHMITGEYCCPVSSQSVTSEYRPEKTIRKKVMQII